MELKTSEEKEKILKEEYNIEISRNMKEELKKMGGLMEPLLNIAAKQAAKQAAEKAAAEATEESKKNTMIANIRSLMKKLNLTAQQAMDILEVPANEQGKYLTLI